MLYSCKSMPPEKNVTLLLSGVPEAPKQPVVKEVYKDSALVAWEQPRDGGKPITNYILEKKETMTSRWTRAVKECIFPEPEYLVQDLLEGCEYEFRVMAENEVGVSDPSPPSKPVFAKDPIGKLLNSVIIMLKYTSKDDIYV